MEKNNIFYIGSLHYWQGVDKTLSIASQMESYANSIFHIVGGGINLNYYKDSFSQLSNVRFHGAIHPTKIDFFWKKSDVILMLRPSTLATESTVPLKLIEAIKHKKLIIASKVRGLTELLDNKNSILVDYNDNHTLIEVLKNPKFFAPTNYKMELENLYLELPDWKTQSDLIENLLLDE